MSKQPMSHITIETKWSLVSIGWVVSVRNVWASGFGPATLRPGKYLILGSLRAYEEAYI
jgi:hypothetical protein